jgi:cholesterol transport system auxiliary component
MTRPTVQNLMLLLLPVLLSACMLTGQTSPISILAPVVELERSADDRTADWSVQVQRPIADQMRDSDRLLVRRTPSRLQVYPGAAWLDSVPEMLQSMMIKSFSDAGIFDGVGRTGGMRTRYSLAMEIRHFEVVDDAGRLSVDIALQASLIHQRSARPVASRSFRHGGAIAGQGVDPIVQGFESALSGLIGELVDWVLDEGLRADAERADQDEDPRRRWRER